MTTILGIDPGGTTGWALFRYSATEPATHITHGMIPGGLQGFLSWAEGASSLGSAFADYGVDEIVIEDFILDSRAKVKPDTTALEIIGAVEARAYAEGIPLIRQRNLYKAQVPDAKLKESGLWFRGAGHDRDAVRHVLALLKIRKHMPTLRRYWPKREAV